MSCTCTAIRTEISIDHIMYRGGGGGGLLFKEMDCMDRGMQRACLSVSLKGYTIIQAYILIYCLAVVICISDKALVGMF